MAAHTYYVDGDNGNDSYDGTVAVFTSGTTGPKATLNGGEDKPVVAGDVVNVRPRANGGAYRELLTVDVSGSTPYTTGVLTGPGGGVFGVTNGSAVVKGSGTTWSSNAYADGQFRPDTYVTGTDGATDTSDTLTSAGASFAAWVVGNCVAIAGKGVFNIIARTATTLQLTKADGTAAAPTSGTGLAYQILPHAPYEILSVDSDTQITLKEPWAGPSMDAVPYETWRDIKYVGDTDGRIWGTGGIVRISGSANDQTATRANCITSTTRNGRTFRGFAFDGTTDRLVNQVTSSNVIIEDCHFQNFTYSQFLLSFSGATSLRNTVRRCSFVAGGAGAALDITHSAVVDNARIILENLDFRGPGGNAGIKTTRVGGLLVRNCSIAHCSTGMQVATALSSGQLMVVVNSIIAFTVNGFVATTTAEFAEDCNTVHCVSAARSAVTAGGQSNTYPPLLQPPLMSAGIFRNAGVALSPASQIRALATVGAPRNDINGFKRPSVAGKNSWGTTQFSPQVRDTGTVHVGTTSRKLPDAGDLPPIYLAVTAVSTTLTLYARREANYAGTNPQVIIREPGQSDITLTDAGSAGAWNALTNTWTPAATTGWIAIIFRSNNTATTGSYGVYFDT